MRFADTPAPPRASMRPPEFTGGNLLAPPAAGRTRAATGFNEAAGIHRRKLYLIQRQMLFFHFASMRPPEFTGGNYGISSISP